MSALIRVDIMLRDAVATPYRDLVTRPMGAAVRDRVLRELRDTPDGDACLDFSHVGVVDFSCADEVVAKLLVAVREPPAPRVSLSGLRQDHTDAIEHALSRQHLVVVTIDATQHPYLLGAVPADWRDAFDVLWSLGRAGAEHVAERLDWPPARAAAALDALAEQRCVRAHPDATFDVGAVS